MSDTGIIISVNGKTLLDAIKDIEYMGVVVRDVVKAIGILNDEVERLKQEVDLLTKWQKSQYVKNRQIPGN